MLLLILSAISPAATAAPAPPPDFNPPECGQTFATPLIDDISIPHDSIPHSWPSLAEFCYQCELEERLLNEENENLNLDPRQEVNCREFLLSGGFIVGSRWILSVVLDDFDPSGYRIRVGVANRSAEPAPPFHLVESIHSYPIFPESQDPGPSLGLYKLRDELHFDATVQPICLPTDDPGMQRDGTLALTVGWSTPTYIVYDRVQQMSVETFFIGDPEIERGVWT